MDLRELRPEFPILEEMAYKDIAYGNPLPNSVRDAMTELLDLQQRTGVSVARSAAFEAIRAKFGHLMGVELGRRLEGKGVRVSAHYGVLRPYHAWRTRSFTMSTGGMLGRPPLGPWLLYMGWMMGLKAVQSMFFLFLLVCRGV